MTGVTISRRHFIFYCIIEAIVAAVHFSIFILEKERKKKQTFFSLK